MALAFLPVWKWLASHGAPIIAALLVGFIAGGKASEERALRAEIKALEKEKADAALAIAENGVALSEAAKALIDAETRRNRQHADFEAVLSRERPALRDGCAPTLAERDSLRRVLEAANRFAAGDVRDGVARDEGAKREAGAGADPRTD